MLASLYAPTIHFHNGTFYIVCTNLVHLTGDTPARAENLVISTAGSWANNWCDPVSFEFNDIDPSLIFDDSKV